MSNVKTVRINGKVSDMCQVLLFDASGAKIEEHSGEVPHVGCFAGGDYLAFRVDNETGVIENWKPIKTLKAE